MHKWSVLRCCILLIGSTCGLIPTRLSMSRLQFMSASLGEYEVNVARSTILMMRELLSERSDLIEKVDELASLLDQESTTESSDTAEASSTPSVKEMVLRATRQDSPARTEKAETPPSEEADSAVKKTVLQAVRQTGPPEDNVSDYIAYRSPDLDYTIWLNKHDPTNSYYEYHKNSQKK